MKFNFGAVTVANSTAAALPVVNALTAEAMLAAPRRGVAIPNPSGEFAIYTNTNYSWSTGKAKTIWDRLDLTSGVISTWTSDPNVAEVVFVGPTNTSILYVNATNEQNDGGISLYTADANELSRATLVTSLPAPYQGLKAVLTSSGDIHFLMYALAYPNGTAYNPKTATPAASTARIYTSIYVRHWDYYLDETRNAVFGGILSTNNGHYSLKGDMINHVTGLCNVTCAESPVQPFGGSDDYDIAPDGSQIVFLTKNVNLPLANFTSGQIYLSPFINSQKEVQLVNPIGAPWTPAEAQGASASPKFSRDGSKIAYVQMNGIAYESDRNILYIADISPASSIQVTALARDWDRSPDQLVWSNDGNTIYVSAPDLGRQRIFPIPISAGADYNPTNITDEGAVASFSILSNDDILISDSKIWSSRDIYSITPTGNPVKTYLQSNLVDLALSGLSSSDVSEFYFSTNTTDIKLQSWIIYPSDFSPNKTYPLCFIIHGGPQGSHSNSWSTRWNFKVWADQGYVVIAPNPTASTGWGQTLTDAIAGHWGDLPYWDLVHAWKYINTYLRYIDTSRGVAAGASFGGFMINWIQGHPLGRRFKALVTHDGVTNSLADYTSEELWFMDHDQLGPFTSPDPNIKSTSTYFKWNPILHCENWATPHFVIHSDLDYRLPVTEGIMLFNMLQVKGVPSKFLNFPDENHWVLERQNSRVWHEEIFRWINYYSGIDNRTGPY